MAIIGLFRWVRDIRGKPQRQIDAKRRYIETRTVVSVGMLLSLIRSCRSKELKGVEQRGSTVLF